MDIPDVGSASVSGVRGPWLLKPPTWMKSLWESGGRPVWGARETGPRAGPGPAGLAGASSSGLGVLAVLAGAAPGLGTGERSHPVTMRAAPRGSGAEQPGP